MGYLIASDRQDPALGSTGGHALSMTSSNIKIYNWVSVTKDEPLRCMSSLKSIPRQICLSYFNLKHFRFLMIYGHCLLNISFEVTVSKQFE